MVFKVKYKKEYYNPKQGAESSDSTKLSVAYTTQHSYAQ
jgi:hypothetical protein